MATDFPAAVRGLGFWIAAVILICVWAGFLFGRIDLPLAFVVSAICAVRL